jgi:hypothetical protein
LPTPFRRLGPDQPLNRCLRSSDPQFGQDVVEGGHADFKAYSGGTMCVHVELPLTSIANSDLPGRYPGDRSGLAALMAAERLEGPVVRGLNDHGERIAAMVFTLARGVSLPPVVGELLPDGRAAVWDGYHRVAAAQIARRSSVAAYLIPGHPEQRFGPPAAEVGLTDVFDSPHSPIEPDAK